MNKVVIFSPSRYSLYTICTAEILRRSNIAIGGIVVRKLFNPRRFVSEFNRDGNRLIRKIWRKLVLRKVAYKAVDPENIANFMIDEKIPFTNVEDFRTHFNIPVIYCDTLNDASVVETLTRLRPDIVVFTGGGLIRDDVLSASGAGVLNCHIGVLPRYRGMDVVEWAILEGNFNDIGVTVHFMDKGVDTGDILKTDKILINNGDSIKTLRHRFEPMMCRNITNCCIDHLNGKTQRITQKKEDGKQYFVMHPRLIEIAEKNLEKYHSRAVGSTIRS